MAAVIGSLRAELSATVAKFEQDMGRAANAVRDVARDMTRVGNDFRKVGSQMQSVGKALTKTITVPLVGIGLALGKVAIDFDEAFDTIRAGTGATGSALAGLSKSFKTVFATVPNEMREVAEAITEVAQRTGLIGKPLEEMATQLLNIARLTKTSVSEAAASATRLFGDWSVATEKQSSSLDLLFRASQQTGIGFQRLSELVVQFGAPMRALGFSFEQTAALMGKFEKEGVNLETVMSGLRFALGKFAAAGKEPAAAFAEIQEKIRGARTETEATAIAFDTFGKRAAVDMSRAILEGRFAIDDLVKSLISGSDTINAAAVETLSFTERMRQLGHEIAVAVEPLGTKLIGALERLIPVMKQAAAFVGRMVDAFTSLPDSVQIGIIGFAGFLAAMGPILFVAGQIVSSLSAIILAFGKTGFATRAIIGTIDLLRVGLGGAGGAFGAARLAAIGFSSTIVGLAIGAAILVIAEAVRRLNQDLDNLSRRGEVGKPLKDLKDGFGNAIVTVEEFKKRLADLNGTVENIVPQMGAFVRVAVPGLAAVGQAAGESVGPTKKFLEAVTSLVEKFVGTGLLATARQYEAALKKIGGTSHLTSAEIDELSDAFEAVIAKYKLLGPSGQKVVQHFQALRDSLRPIPQAVRDLERGFDGLEDAIKDFGTTFRPTMADVPLASHDLIALTGELLKVSQATQRWIDTLSDIGIQVDEMSGSLRLTTDDLRLFRQEGQHAFDLDSNVHALAESFARLAQISGDSFGGIVQDIAQVIGALDLANQSIKQFTKQGATTGDKISAIAGGIAAVAQATSTGKKSTSIAGGAVTGAKLGASIGSVVPVIGTAFGAAFGAIGGALVGYFRSRGPEWKKLAKDIGRDLGVNISSQFAKEMEAQSKQVGRQITETMNIAKIAMEGGGLDSTNIDKFTHKLRDTFVFIGQGSLTAAQGAKVLDQNFQAFADHFLQNGGLISTELQEIIRLNDDWGTHSKAIGDFISEQITGKILPGLQAFTGAAQTAREKLAALQEQAKTATGDDLKKITNDIKTQQGVIAATAVTSQASVDGLAAAVRIAFFEMQKLGIPILEIVGQLTPVVEGLQAQFDAAGLSGGAAFDDIRATIALASDEIAGPALQAVSGLGAALAGLHNIAQLDQTTFQGLSGQITSTFNNLVAQGFDGNRVLGLMREPLQTIWVLAKDFGFAVDEGTQALLDQAEGAGLVGEHMKPIQQQMLDATKNIQEAVEGLAEVFGVVLPRKAREAAQAIAEAMNRIPDADVTVHIGYDDPGHTPDVNAPPEFQHGSGGIRDFGAGTLAVLHGREAVFTEADLQDIRQWPQATAAGAERGGDTYYLSIPITAFDGESVRDMVVKPGGIADLLVDEIQRDKRGRGTKIRRAVTV